MADTPAIAVVNTGTELLLGRVINTHLAFLAESIFPLGLRIDQQITLPDGPVIGDTLRELSRDTDLILVTGGLGPTSDDLTREVVADLFGLPLELHPPTLAAIEERFARRGFQVNDDIRRQAYAPRGSEVLANPHGTAPGIYLPPSTDRPALFLLPGPPRELRPMVEAEVIPRLQRLFPDTAQREMRNYYLCGIGESMVEARLGSRLAEIRGLEIGYCARSGEVHLRCIGTTVLLEQADRIIRPEMEPHLVSTDGADLETVVVRTLRALDSWVAVAESCTGGLLAHRITNVPGSSEVFLEGLVTYSNQSKMDRLGVRQETLQQHGAVSAETAREMAASLLQSSGADYAVTTTGIAGPGGGSEAKPVGTLFVGLAGREIPPLAEKFFYPSDRETFKFVAAQSALNLLRNALGERMEGLANPGSGVSRP